MEEEQKGSSQKRGDPFTQLMFGTRSQGDDTNKQPQPLNGPYLDYEELMKNIGNLMDSVQNLKPVFQKALPVVRTLWKKKDGEDE